MATRPDRPARNPAYAATVAAQKRESDSPPPPPRRLLDDPVDSLAAPGTVLGDYVVEEHIASGGCGAVYRASHRVLGRRAALKLLHSSMVGSPEMIERFTREARVVNRIQHPAIVDIYDYGVHDDGRPYFIMELLPGRNLRSRLTEFGPMSTADVLRVLDPVCAALEAAHDIGVIHRDIKASNVFLCKRGDRQQVKLLDFGIAKLTEQWGQNDCNLTAEFRRVGTPTNMAPEQILGQRIDERTDVYALGVLLFHLVTGDVPFDHDNMYVVEEMQLSDSPPPASSRAQVPPALDRVIFRAMEKRPADRYDSVRTFRDNLHRAVRSSPKERTRSRMNAASIYVEIRVGSNRVVANPEATYAATEAAVDAASEVLERDRFVSMSRTNNSVTAVLLLSSNGKFHRADLSHVERIARSVRAAVQQLLTGTQLVVNICIHSDTAEVKVTPNGPSVVGGGVLHVATWAPRDDSGGIFASARFRKARGSTG